MRINQSYAKNYLKIYVWQIFGVVLNFLSLFIVIPKISSNPSVYGIYSLCLSFVVFLSYADLGFLSAGYKYASEFFAKNQKKEEVEVTAFVALVLLAFTVLFSCTILFFAVYPKTIFKDISADNFLIARRLLLILSCSAPLIVCQRIIQIIYGVRLKDYIFQQINVTGNIIKLLGIFFFFPNNEYGDIVGYFLFLQAVGIIVTIISGFVVQKKFDYSFKTFIKNFRFNPKVFNQTKSLALGSLLLSLSWIVYYELDLLVISKFLGAPSAAIYNIGLTILSLFRSMYAILFNPFNARFNHLKGLQDVDGLKKMVISVVRLSLPIFVLPIFIISLFSKQLILVWLGEEYIAAIPIVQILIFCNFFGFVTNPTGILIIVLEKTKLIYKISWLMPLFYWLTILAFYNPLGLLIFPIAKFAVFLFMTIIYARFLFKFIGYKNLALIGNDIFKISIILLITYPILHLLSIYNLPLSKNFVNLCIILCSIGIILCFTLLSYYTYNTSFNKMCKLFYKNFNLK
jgi:O-antigen/teichoic acid export membrane protein